MEERIKTFKFIYSKEEIISCEDHPEENYTLIQVSDGSWYKQTDTVTSWIGYR